MAAKTKIQDEDSNLDLNKKEEGRDSDKESSIVPFFSFKTSADIAVLRQTSPLSCLAESRPEKEGTWLEIGIETNAGTDGKLENEKSWKLFWQMFRKSVSTFL